MVTHLSEVIKQNVSELLSRGEVMQLIDNLKKISPQLVEEAFPNIISYGSFKRYFQTF